MKTLIRIILTFISAVASFYFFIYLIPLLITGVDSIPAIPLIVSLLIAISIGIILWKKTGAISNDLAKFVILGGIIIGSIGFVLGFFGPIIFYPSANQGPLLGIFITGPIGFLIGLVGGGIYWRVKVKSKKN